MTRRLWFVLDLADDAALIARYREWHRPGGPPAAADAADPDVQAWERLVWETTGSAR